METATIAPTQRASAPRLAPEVEEELVRYEARVDAFLRGDLGAEEFKAFRLMHGVYGQRQQGVHMIRVKVPHGDLTPAQFRRLAELSESSSNGIGHVTTRSDVQFHYVPLDQTPTFLRRLAEVGLTTREACGNTVRNVTACFLAGVCRFEAFDVTPYADLVSRYFLRHPLVQALPRKFKISASGCSTDCALAGIHDLGIVATVRIVGAKTERGLKLYVGGGLGAFPIPAQLLEAFVPAEELLAHVEAILRVYEAHGERKDRNRARIKFLVQKLGVAEFRRLYLEALDVVRSEGKRYPTIGESVLDIEAVDEVHAPAEGTPFAPKAAPAGATPYEVWRTANVLEQKQKGFYAVQVLLVRGNLTAAQFRGLADVAERHASGRIRTTIHQNVSLEWIAEADLPAVFEGLSAIGLAEAGALGIHDVVACPGSTTCQIGITKAIELGAALHDRFVGRFAKEPDLAGVRVRISGCPNSCGHHHIGSLGFFGTSRNVDGEPVPHYQVLVGGSGDGETVRIGRPVLRVPSARVPETVERLITLYRERRGAGETFDAFYRRIEIAVVKGRLADLADVPPREVDPAVREDWGGGFTLKGVGKGECSA